MKHDRSSADTPSFQRAWSRRTRLVASVAIAAFSSACVATDRGAPPANAEERKLADDVALVDLHGEPFIAAAGTLIWNDSRATWRTRVGETVYVVTGEVESLEPLVGSLAVSDQHGQAILELDLSDTLWSLSTGHDSNSVVAWADTDWETNPTDGLTNEARALLGELEPVPTTAAPLLLEGFLQVLLSQSQGIPSGPEGVGKPQPALAGILLALAALITAIAKLIDSIAEAGDCPPTSASCENGEGSVTCNNCLSARCTTIYGVAGAECVCTCF